MKLQQIIPQRKKKQFQQVMKTRCVSCGNEFDLVSTIFIPICNNCRMKRNNKIKGKQHDA